MCSYHGGPLSASRVVKTHPVDHALGQCRTSSPSLAVDALCQILRTILAISVLRTGPPNFKYSAMKRSPPGGALPASISFIARWISSFVGGKPSPERPLPRPLPPLPPGLAPLPAPFCCRFRSSSSGVRFTNMFMPVSVPASLIAFSFTFSALPNESCNTSWMVNDPIPNLHFSRKCPEARFHCCVASSLVLLVLLGVMNWIACGKACASNHHW